MCFVRVHGWRTVVIFIDSKRGEGAVVHHKRTRRMRLVTFLIRSNRRMRLIRAHRIGNTVHAGPVHAGLAHAGLVHAGLVHAASECWRVHERRTGRILERAARFESVEQTVVGEAHRVLERVRFVTFLIWALERVRFVTFLIWALERMQ